MSNSTIQKLYLDNVTFTNEAEGVFLPERRCKDNYDFYRFHVQVDKQSHQKVKELVIKMMGANELANKPWSFVADPLDGRSDEEQEYYAFFECYGKKPTYNTNTGRILTHYPTDCTTSCDELRLVYFRQLDEPKVINAEFGENLNGRTGSIQYHLTSLDNGQVYAYAQFIQLDPIFDDYVPTGESDGGMF